MQASLRFIREGSRTAALRIVPPENGIVERTPSHFIALIDISDSMHDNNKLSHVKHCLSLLLGYLTANDELSLVTFGDAAATHFSRLKMSPAGVATANATIQALHTDGCTNLSAGLAAVRDILQSVTDSRSRLKQGVLILTDGHANRGVYEPTELRSVGKRLFELFPGLSMSYVAYGGTTHNADLLKGMAEDVNGAYSIVECIEDAALSMGEMLGGILSCVAQNVTVTVGQNVVVRGPPRPRTPDGTAIQIGDIYAGTPVLLLLDFPPESLVNATVRGAILPTLDIFSIEMGAAAAAGTQRDIEVELTELRYKCSDLYKKIQTALDQRRAHQVCETIREEIAQLRSALEDDLYAGHPILELLSREIPSLEAAITAAAAAGEEAGGMNPLLLRTQLLQHEAFVALGRGASQPIGYNEAEEGEDLLYSGDSDTGSPLPGDPRAATSMPRTHRVARRSNASYLSPTSSTTARRVATQLRTASQLNA